jgi:hypothetical protein
MKRVTEKHLIKRKKEREDFPDFYKKHVEVIKNTKACCSECGIRLLGDVSEVAHILNKSTYKSVSTNDINVVYLCGWKQNNCHDKFDSGKDKEMKIFPLVVERFNLLKDFVKEKINFKIWEKWGT